MIPLGIQRRQLGLTGCYLEVSVLILLLIFDKSRAARAKWMQLFLPIAVPSTRNTEEMQRELDEILEECNKEEGHLLRRYCADTNSMWSTGHRTHLRIEYLSLSSCPVPCRLLDIQRRCRGNWTRYWRSATMRRGIF